MPLALLGLAAWAYPRLRGGRRGALSLFLGVLGIAAGVEAIHYTRTVGASGDDFTGLLAIPAGLLLLGLGAARCGARGGPRQPRWRYARRALLGVAGVSSRCCSCSRSSLGYVTTHVGRAVVPENQLGVDYET